MNLNARNQVPETLSVLNIYQLIYVYYTLVYQNLIFLQDHYLGHSQRR